MRRWATATTLLVAACVGQLDPPPPRAAEQFTQGRALVDLDALAVARERADAAPDDIDAQWSAGMAHARASLQGHVELRDHAERYLERAWLLDPHADQVPAAQVLARFLNIRTSVLDLARLELQIALYESLIEPEQRERGPVTMAAEQFHFASFAAAAEALQTYDQGRTLAALRRLNRLERDMKRRAAAHPDDIDSCAMAGNFELTFAGVIPVGVERRLARGVDYLATQQDHWEQLSPRARSTAIAPNVRSVFALFLAEGLLARGDEDDAARRYRELIELEDQPDTAPRRQIVALAQHRLEHLDAYAGDRALLPPWPSGVTGCVACHSREATLPTDDLYLLEVR
jgi:tetratricopeptide (TPR) repeat protein